MEARPTAPAHPGTAALFSLLECSVGMPAPHLLLSLLLLGLPTGCSTRKAYRAGQAAEEGAQPVTAAVAYLDALDSSPRHKKASTGLDRTAEDACFALLFEAERQEKAEAWAAAAQDYEELSAFLGRLAQHGRRSCTSVNVVAKSQQMHEQAAEALYVLGQTAEGSASWEEAIQHFLAAQRHQPAYRDTHARIARAQYYLAGQRQRGGQYRAAAALYLEAAASLQRARPPEAGGEIVDLAPLRDAPTRAGRIYLGLGRWFIGRGACRQAVEDLERARNLLGAATSTVEAELARATACATIHIVPVPLDNRAGEAALPLVGELSRTVALDAQRRGSRYLAWHRVGGLPPVGGDWVWKGVAASAEWRAIGGSPWLLAGQVTDYDYRPSTRERRREQMAGQEEYPCEGGTCTRAITMEYTRVRQSVELTARADLFLLRPATGERVAVVSETRSVSDEVEYAIEIVAHVSPEASSWTMPGQLSKLQEARQLLIPEPELLRTLAPPMSEVLAARLIAQIDAPPLIADPLDVPELSAK